MMFSCLYYSQLTMLFEWFLDHIMHLLDNNDKTQNQTVDVASRWRVFLAFLGVFSVLSVSDAAASPVPTFASSVRPSIGNHGCVITTVVGTGATTMPPAAAAIALDTTLSNPYSVWGDTIGILYISDSSHFQIRKVDSLGIISQLIGTGTEGVSGDGGRGTSATIKLPYQLHGDTAGQNIYFADSSAAKVRVYNIDLGLINLLAGTGDISTTIEGAPATSSAVASPKGVWVDSSSRVFISSLGHNKIRVVQNGIMNTFAGTGTSPTIPVNVEAIGNGGAATSANLRPVFLFGDNQKLFFSDSVSSSNIVGLIRVISQSSTIITLYAGNGQPTPNPSSGAATAMSIVPTGVWGDMTGNIFISDKFYIKKVDTSGWLSTYAGSASEGFGGDGGLALSTSVKLRYVEGIFVDTIGDVYFADRSNNRIRKIYGCMTNPSSQPSGQPSLLPLIHSSSGTFACQLSTVIGTGGSVFSGDNIRATSATIFSPRSVWSDDFGIMYVAETGSARIRKVDPDGIISTVMGTGEISSAGMSTSALIGDSGPATSATVSGLRQIFLRDNKLHFIDLMNCKIRTVDLLIGEVSLTLGTGFSQYNGNGIKASSANLNYPAGLSIDSSGNFYVGEFTGKRLRKWDVSTGNVYTIAGTGLKTPFDLPNGDGGPATSATFVTPYQISGDSSGMLYIADFEAHKVRVLDLQLSVIHHFAGTGSNITSSSSSGAATSVPINGVVGVWSDGVGNVFLSEGYGMQVKVVDSAKFMTTKVGSGFKSSSSMDANGDGGDLTSATLRTPFFLFVDSFKSLFISDSGNNKIRKVSGCSDTAIPSVHPTSIEPTVAPTRIPSVGNYACQLSTIAGNGNAGYIADNVHATSTSLSSPNGLWSDMVGNLFIADTTNARIRKVSVDGIITTVAGTVQSSAGASTSSMIGDGGPATSATLFNPNQITGVIDSNNTLVLVFFADASNNKIRIVSPSDGVIESLAGNGLSISNIGDISATSASFKTPVGVWVDTVHNVYVSEKEGNKLRRVNTTSRIVSVFAGTGIGGSSGDNGKATNANLYNPCQLFGNNFGQLMIADSFSNKIRIIDISSGIISTMVGGGGLLSSGTISLAATSIDLKLPMGVWGDAAGNVYISEYTRHRILMMNSGSFVRILAGSGFPSAIPVLGNGDSGDLLLATFKTPTNLFVDTSGALFIADTGNNKVRIVSECSISERPSVLPTVLPSVKPTTPTVAPTNLPSVFPSVGGFACQIKSVIGTGGIDFNGDGIVASAANINSPTGVWGDSAGNLYISEIAKNRVRKMVADTGLIHIIAGSGVTSPLLGDGGPATAATFKSPYQLIGDVNNTLLYIADAFNHRVRVMNMPLGIITTVVGTGTMSSTGDGGAASSAAVNQPIGVWTDSIGYVYISEFTGSRIKRVGIDGIISTIAGTGTYGPTAAGVAATSTTIGHPNQLFGDSKGYLYYADSPVRKLSLLTGILSTVMPSSVSIQGLWGDRTGNLYFSELTNHRIKKVATDGIVHLVAGNGVESMSSALIGDDGPAVLATMKSPKMIFVDTVGNVYFSDNGNNRLRIIHSCSVSELPSVTPSNSPSFVPTLMPSTMTPTITPSQRPSYQLSALTQISTPVGNGTSSSSGDGGLASAASVWNPQGVWADLDGKLYVSDGEGNKMRRVDAVSQIITTLAGTGTGGSSGDGGPASAAMLFKPHQIFGNSANILYICCYNEYKVRTINLSTGIIALFAGSGSNSVALSGNGGKATSATLKSPSGIWEDSSGNVYISEYSRYVRKVSSATNDISLITGTGVLGSFSDGVFATSAGIGRPFQICGSMNGLLYFADVDSNAVWRVNLDNRIRQLAGNGANFSSNVPGQATAVPLYGPVGINLDLNGNFLITENTGNRVKKLTVGDNMMVTIAGTGTASGNHMLPNGDGGPPTAAKFNGPHSVFVDTAGVLFIVDKYNNKVRKMFDFAPTLMPSISPSQRPSVVPSCNPSLLPSITPSQQPSYLLSSLTQIGTSVGTGVASSTGDGGLASAASVQGLPGVWADPVGNLFVADENGHKVRKVDGSSKIITTVAGTGSIGGSGDGGPASAAQLQRPQQIFGNTANLLYIACFGNNKIRTVDLSNGIIALFAGNGLDSLVLTGDGGKASSATLKSPSSVWEDSSGNVYISEYFSYYIRKVSSFNYISVLVGTGVDGVTGDGGRATSARIGHPFQICGSLNGLLYLADSGSHSIRSVNLESSIIGRIAGNGVAASSNAPKQATSVSLNLPVGVNLDLNGNFFITENVGMRVKKLTAIDNVMLTIAGTGIASAGATFANGDGGSPTSATFNVPHAVFVDTVGVLFIADMSNNKVRKLFDFVPTVMPSATPSSIVSALPSFSPSCHPSTSSSTVPSNLPSIVSTFTPSTLSSTIAPSQRPSYQLSLLVQIGTSVGTGEGSSTGDGGLASAASVTAPRGVWADPEGNLCVSDGEGNRIRSVNAVSQIITTLAGTGIDGSSGDGGPASAAMLSQPRQIFGNTANLMYITCFNDNKVRVINLTTGIITLFAGNGQYSVVLNGNGGKATSAILNNPSGIWEDSIGNVFITQYDNYVRKVSSTNSISVIAGTGVSGSFSDGSFATSASIGRPYQICGSANGLLYFADFDSNAILRINSVSNTISRFAGNGESVSSSLPGQATAISLNGPVGVNIDLNGNFLITENVGMRVKRVAVNDNVIVTIAGTGETSTSSTSKNGDGGPPTSATFNAPHAVFVDTVGQLFIVDKSNNKVRKMFDFVPTLMPSVAPSQIPSVWFIVNPSLQPSVTSSMKPSSPSKKPSAFPSFSPVFVSAMTRITTIAGNGEEANILPSVFSNGNDGPAVDASFYSPACVWEDSLGTIYVSDPVISAVRKFTRDGLIHVFAGFGESGDDGDEGSATSARIALPQQVYGGVSHYLYIALSGSSKIRIVNTRNGIISTCAGTGNMDFHQDGLHATSTDISSPYGVWCDTQGNVYLSENQDYYGVRKVSYIDRVVTTLSGVGDSVSPIRTDNEQASSVRILAPSQLYGDTAGVLYIVETLGHRVLKLDLEYQLISTLIGTGDAISSDGMELAIVTPLSSPAGVWGDAKGNVYVSESDANRIKKIDSRTLLAFNIAGEGISLGGFSGDGGPPLEAVLSLPMMLCVGHHGNLLFADSGNRRIRQLYDSEPTSQPSSQPTTPTSQPTGHPSTQSTSNPSRQPTEQPVFQPSSQPSEIPSAKPTSQPSSAPNGRPTCHPSAGPTTQPSSEPSSIPSEIVLLATSQPIADPSGQPSSIPSRQPSVGPSSRPSSLPTVQSVARPTTQPTNKPTELSSVQLNAYPGSQPSNMPSSYPSCQPFSIPSNSPVLTASPSQLGTTMLSVTPTSAPTVVTSNAPSVKHTSSPVLTIVQPSLQPSTGLSDVPTLIVSESPSQGLSEAPSVTSTVALTVLLTDNSSTTPSVLPSVDPSISPTELVTVAAPTCEPSGNPPHVPLVSTITPTGKSSQRPTLRPTTVPTATPSVAPSLLPTVLPTATKVPTLSPSARPSLVTDTISPSLSIVDKWKAKFVEVESDVKASVPNEIAHMSVYSELDVSENIPCSLYGSCSSWASLLSADVEPSSYLYKASLIQITVVTTLNGGTTNIRCDEWNRVQQLVSHLTQYNSTALSVTCGEHTWQSKYCSSTNPLPSLCVDCIDPCSSVSHCSTSSHAFGVSPCVTQLCSGESGVTTSAIRILSIGFQESEQPPVILDQSIVANRTSISVITALSKASSIYCAVYPHFSLQSAWNYVPGSLSEIMLQNHVAATQSSNMSILNIHGLNAVSNYSVYCFAMSVSNVMTPLTAVLSNVRIMETACCKTLSVRVSSPTVSENVLMLNYLTLTLSAPPSSHILVQIQVYNIATNTLVDAFVPSNFAVNSSRISDPVVLTSSLQALPAGAYSLQVNISGESYTDYEIIYGVESSRRRLISASSSFQQFAVLSSSEPVPAPELTSAIFSKDGSHLLILFDSKTDYGGTATIFACSQLFSFTCAEISRCHWIDEGFTVKVFVAILDYCAVPGNTLTLNVSAVIKAKCTSLSGECTTANWPQTNSATLVIQSPSTAILPVVSLPLPNTIGLCSPLTLDISGSSGSGGRVWASYNISVASSVSVSNVTAIQRFLSTTYTMSPPSAIPYQMLVSGATYTFTVTVCNFLKLCGQKSTRITVLSTSLPSLSLPGATLRYATRNKPLAVGSYAYKTTCDGGMSSSGLTFQWSVSANNAIVPLLESKSKDSTKLLLPAFSLSTGTMYTISLTTSVVSTSKSTVASVQVFVQPGNVISRVSGGSVQTVQVSSLAQLDASGSYDEDQSEVTGIAAGLRFNWVCQQISPVIAEDCTSIFDDISSISYSDSVFSATTRPTAGNVVAQLSVIVSDIDESRSSTTIVTLKVLPSQSPLVSLDTVNNIGVVNRGQEVKLVGKISLPSNVAGNAVWSVSDTSVLDLTSVSLSPLTNAIPAGVLSFDVYLALVANSLPTGSMLTFNLKCTTANNFNSVTSITVVVNAPPAPGTFQVMPLATITGRFTFLALNWGDIDRPITYQFGYISNAGTQVVLISKSESTHGVTSIPAGLASNDYMVRCFAEIVDSFGANSTDTAAVRVPEISTSSVERQTKLNTLLNTRPTTVNEIKQVSAMASALLNQVDCSAATNCASFNRAKCHKTKNTCGICLKNYVGDAGDSNSACVSASLLKRTGETRLLTEADECSGLCEGFEICISGQCITPQKSCPEDCNGRGQCRFVKVDSGRSIDACLVGDTSCTVVCECSDDYVGSSDCSVTNDELIARQGSRLLVLQNIKSLLDLEDPDQQSVVSWINSLSEATQSPDELNEEALSLVLSLSTSLMEYASSIGISVSYVQLLLNSIDAASKASESYYQRRRRLSGTSSSNYTSTLLSTQNSLKQFNDLVSNNMLPGQYPIQLVYSQFRSNIQVVSMTGDGSNVSMRIPLSELETLNGRKASRISIPRSNDSSRAIRMSVTSMLSSLYSTLGEAMESNPVTVQMSALPNCASPPCRMEVVLQYSQTLNHSRLEPNKPEMVRQVCAKGINTTFNHTCMDGRVMYLYCNGSAHVLNTQCPYTTYSPTCNTLLGLNITSGGCVEIAHSNTSITCSCLSEFYRRRLQSDNSSDGYSASYVSMLHAVESSFVTTVTSADDLNADTLKTGWRVIVTISTFAAAIVVAVMLANNADEREKKKKTKTGDSNKKRLTINTVFSQNRKSRAQSLKKNTTSVVKHKDLAMIENSLPSVLSSLSLPQKIFNEVKHHHRWLGVVFFYCDSFPRVLRVISLATNIIIMLFIQSVTYTLTNPDDGSCELLTTKATCIEPQSPFATGESKCSWSETTGCTFIQPSGSAKIILFVAIFSAIVSTPIALTTDWIVRHILSAATSKKPTGVLNGGHRGSSLVPMSGDGIMSERRSGLKNSKLSSLFVAQSELRALSADLNKYRDGLSTSQRVEFDAVWGLSADGQFLSPDNQSDSGQLLSRLNVFKETISAQPNVKQLVLDDLIRTVEAIDEETKEVENGALSNREVGKKLLFLFQCDLLPGVSGQILQSKGRRDAITAKRVPLTYKICGWLIIVLMNAGMLFYIMLFALGESEQRQGAWFRSFILWLVVEIVMVSTAIAVFTHVFIPMLTMKDVTKIKQRLMDSIQAFHENVGKQSLYTQQEENKPFNAAEYLFVSTRLARKYPDLKEAQIIAQFSTPWPKQSYQHATDVSKNYSKKFTAMTRAFSIVTVYAFSSVLSIPPTLQDMVIHMVTTATVGYTILLHIDLFGIFPLLAFGPFLIACLVLHFFIQAQKAAAKQRLAKLFPVPTFTVETSTKSPKKVHMSRKQSVLQGVNIANKIVDIQSQSDRLHEASPISSKKKKVSVDLSVEESKDEESSYLDSESVSHTGDNEYEVNHSEVSGNERSKEKNGELTHTTNISNEKRDRSEQLSESLVSKLGSVSIEQPPTLASSAADLWTDLSDSSEAASSVVVSMEIDRDMGSKMHMALTQSLSLGESEENNENSSCEIDDEIQSKEEQIRKLRMKVREVYNNSTHVIKYQQDCKDQECSDELDNNNDDEDYDSMSVDSDLIHGYLDNSSCSSDDDSSNDEQE